MNCPHCSSTNIKEGVSIGKTGDSGSIGPQYRFGIVAGTQYRFGIDVGTAPMFCDLCLDCGEITRMYVKEKNLDKKWC